MPNCTTCGKKSTSAYCFSHKPRKAIATNKPLVSRSRLVTTTPLKATKPMKKHGKVHETWMRTRGDWLTANPAPWHCHYCDKALDITTITLDHKIPRSRRPDLRYALDNLVPCCFVCNVLKGSTPHDRFNHDCKD